MSNEARFAVIFVSQRTDQDPDGYVAAAERMEELARRQDGFVAIHSARGADGKGITVSYWSSLDSIRRWAADAEHRAVQKKGRDRWYQSYEIAVAQIERQSDFIAAPTNDDAASCR